MPQLAVSHKDRTKILLIEPDANKQQARTALLNAAGYLVECASDRSAASTMCADRCFDLIVVECIIGKDGRLVCGEPLLERLPGQRVLLLLGSHAILCPVFAEGVLVRPREGTEGFLERIAVAFAKHPCAN